MLSIVLLKDMKKPMSEVDKKVLENEYLAAMFEFLKNSTVVIEGATMAMSRSTVDGFNQRFNREIMIDDTIYLSGHEWNGDPDLLNSYQKPVIRVLVQRSLIVPRELKFWRI